MADLKPQMDQIRLMLQDEADFETRQRGSEWTVTVTPKGPFAKPDLLTATADSAENALQAIENGLRIELQSKAEQFARANEIKTAAQQQKMMGKGVPDPAVPMPTVGGPDYDLPPEPQPKVKVRDRVPAPDSAFVSGDPQPEPIDPRTPEEIARDEAVGNNHPAP